MKLCRTCCKLLVALVKLIGTLRQLLLALVQLRAAFCHSLTGCQQLLNILTCSQLRIRCSQLFQTIRHTLGTVRNFTASINGRL
ncbi:hypothetical protein D3C76_1580920 [compost metagenome]